MNNSPRQQIKENMIGAVNAVLKLNGSSTELDDSFDGTETIEPYLENIIDIINKNTTTAKPI